MFGQETISPKKVDVDKMEKLKFNKMLLSDKQNSVSYVEIDQYDFFDEGPIQLKSQATPEKKKPYQNESE